MDIDVTGSVWSLLPPIVAICLALKTKEVYSSLFVGIIFAIEFSIIDLPRGSALQYVGRHGHRRLFESHA